MKAQAAEKKRSYPSSSYDFWPVHSPESWQAALKELPQAHTLQSWVWGAFKSRWGWSPQRLLLHAGREKEQPIAAAAVLKRRAASLPFSILYVPRGPVFDYCDAELRQIVFEKLEQLARQERAIMIKIDPEVVRAWNDDPEQPHPVGPQVIKDLEARGWRFSNEQVQFRNTVLLDLTPSEEELLANMKQKTRYNIRLAGRKEVRVRQGDNYDFPLIANMYQETAARDGFAIRPLAYYLDAWQTLYDAGLAMPFIAEYQGTPLAAVIIVKSGERAIYMYGASTDLERQRMPTYLLQWEAICWAKAEGCTVYDFWGAPDDFTETDRMWGVWRFKAGFNGQIVKHIGAWDFPARPVLYWLYTVLLPRYISFLRRKKS